MTMPSNVVPDTPVEPGVMPPGPFSATRPLYWSVRRELWENRSLTIAPLIAAAVVLFGFSISVIGLPERRRAAVALDPAQLAVAIALPYDFAAIAILVTGMILAAFYCLGALHNERRDRSILFWKSLPVSDLTTVLSKASIPVVVLPLIVFVVIGATQLIMLALSTVVLLAGGVDAATTWTRLPLFEMPLVLLYGLAVLALWYAPVWGWLLLVSGWARRAPFLWAVLPLLAVCLVEKIAFNSANFASMLMYRLGGFTQAFTMRAQGDLPTAPLPRPDPVDFLSTPGLWVGLVFAAAFLGATVWLRHRREPI